MGLLQAAIPLFTKEPLSLELQEQLGSKALAVLDSGKYILGPEVAAFEEEFASYLGIGHAVGVANGTDALTIALKALGVGPGDDVIVPSFTFYASAEAIPHTGARPVFCDIDPATYCVTVESVKAALTPDTKAVIAVDLFGNVAPIKELREELGIPVIEDAAQAAGSLLDGKKAGTFGDIATFSFFPSKNLGGFGDGGAVVTDNAELAEKVRMFRFHGSKDKQTFVEVGYNSRLDELQAALLRVMLTQFDAECGGRRKAASYYQESELGTYVSLPAQTPLSDPVWHLYVVRSKQAELLETSLKMDGIASKGYYRVPIHRQPAMQDYAEGCSLPATDEVAATHLALPFGSALSMEQVERTSEIVKQCVSG